MITIRTTERNGEVVGVAQVVDDDEVMLITDGGKVLRCPVSGISTMGRATQGVRVMNLATDRELVASMARLAEADVPTIRWREPAPTASGDTSPASLVPPGVRPRGGRDFRAAVVRSQAPESTRAIGDPRKYELVQARRSSGGPSASIPGASTARFARSARWAGVSPLHRRGARGVASGTPTATTYIDYVGSWGPMILGHAEPGRAPSHRG